MRISLRVLPLLAIAAGLRRCGRGGAVFVLSFGGGVVVVVVDGVLRMGRRVDVVVVVVGAGCGSTIVSSYSSISYEPPLSFAIAAG